ncbi:hypothetical protein IKF76_00460 [Candidatus Saccharibacteria bacterium]|nr:hypothetical protein [Candidatus Saccharibacteria bacterium]
MRKKWSKWWDELSLALKGVLLATRYRKFNLIAVVAFLIFGALLNLLASGTASLSLFGVADFGGKMQIIWDALLGIFGVGRNFLDFLLIFFISLLQSILIGLVAFVWKKRKDSVDDLQRTGIVAGLAVLGSGCPTCGTTLLGPLVAAVVGSGGVALASALSGIFTALAIILAIFALKKLGLETYAIIMDEKYRRKNAGQNH